MTPPPSRLLLCFVVLLLSAGLGCGSDGPAAPGLTAEQADIIGSLRTNSWQGNQDAGPPARVMVKLAGSHSPWLELLGLEVVEDIPQIETAVIQSRYGNSAAWIQAALDAFGFEDAEADGSVDYAESQGMSVSFDEGMSISFDDGMSVSFDEGMSVSFDDGMSVSFDEGMSVSFDDGRIGGAAEEQEFLELLRAADAHTLARGAGIVVALLDTGVDPTHPGLHNRVERGWDYIDQDDDPAETRDGIDSDMDGFTDEAFGHGSHVAGLIALAAPRAKIRVYRVLDDDGRGVASRISQAIVRAVQDGCHVINLSLGMTGDFRSVDKAIVFAESRGVVVITSAGNQAGEIQQYPALYEWAAAVGSMGTEALSPFSNRGSGVWVVAPGERLRSTVPGGGYGVGSGTSMAAAVVTGLAALVIERNPYLDAEAVRERIASSAVPGTDAAGEAGAGRVDFLNALQ